MRTGPELPPNSSSAGAYPIGSSPEGSKGPITFNTCMGKGFTPQVNIHPKGVIPLKCEVFGRKKIDP